MPFLIIYLNFSVSCMSKILTWQNPLPITRNSVVVKWIISLGTLRALEGMWESSTHRGRIGRESGDFHLQHSEVRFCSPVLMFWPTAYFCFVVFRFLLWKKEHGSTHIDREWESCQIPGKVWKHWFPGWPDISYSNCQHPFASYLRIHVWSKDIHQFLTSWFLDFVTIYAVWWS